LLIPSGLLTIELIFYDIDHPRIFLRYHLQTTSQYRSIHKHWSRLSMTFFLVTIRFVALYLMFYPSLYSHSLLFYLKNTGMQDHFPNKLYYKVINYQVDTRSLDSWTFELLPCIRDEGRRLNYWELYSNFPITRSAVHSSEEKLRQAIPEHKPTVSMLNLPNSRSERSKTMRIGIRGPICSIL
jgi:hypothetical protein